MEVAHGGAKTRAMEVTSSESSKRRKIDSRELLQSSSSNFQLVISPENSVSPATSGASDHFRSSLFSSSELLKDEPRSLDLKTEGLEGEIFKFINGSFSRERTPSSEMDSSTTSKKKTSLESSKLSPSRMPSTTEIEEFFSVTEKSEQKRFAEKYNYDIVKDVPLEGRYQWVRLKP